MKRKPFGIKEFLDKANETHNFKYDYSKFRYVNSQTKGQVICPKHGEFLQSPNQHLNRRGCPKCGRERIIKSHEYDTKEFVKRAKKFHGSKYNYDKTEYINSKTFVVISCSEHGDFEQIAGNHLRGWGCHLCGIETFINCNRWGRKEFIFPNGRIEKVQGYEPLTLNYLLSSSIEPNDIKVSGKEKPIINYYWSGSQRKYFPDCYVSSSNTIVETKSEWTWNSQLEQNQAKITGSIESGYNIRFFIWDERKNKLLEDKTYVTTDKF